jgi:hypothetical protein
VLHELWFAGAMTRHGGRWGVQYVCEEDEHDKRDKVEFSGKG